MSFEKDYPNRKDWRKRYWGVKAWDAWFRRGGIYWERIKKYKELKGMN